MNKIFTLVTICLALFACAGCGAVEPPAARTSAAPNSAQADAAAQADDQKNATMITITNNGHKITFALNDSPASQALHP